MPARLVRILTALVVVGMCAPVVLKGSDIILFSIADNADGDPSDDQIEAMRPWTAVPGLAFSALQSSLHYVKDRNDLKETTTRRDGLIEILGVRPLSSEYWLWLSDMRWVTGSPASKVAEAMAFSALTGANEYDIMVQRGIYGLAHWEILPPELQSRAANDLVAASLTDIGYTATSEIRRILSAKSADVRQQIRTALEAQQVSANGLTAIGL